jgi:hypothetical protein
VPEPLPIEYLVEADLWSQLPPDLPELLALLPRADLYLQDEVQFAFHPTLTRVWSRHRVGVDNAWWKPQATTARFMALAWWIGAMAGLMAGLLQDGRPMCSVNKCVQPSFVRNVAGVLPS